MSLFDVFRYPVVDIYNAEELAGLPNDLYQAWVASLYDNNVKSLSPLRHIEVRAAVLLRVFESRRNDIHTRSQQGWEDLWKAVFTKSLLSMIKEYDTA